MAASEVTRAALLGAVALGAPGIAGVLWGRGRGAPRRFVQGLAGATLASVAAAVALQLVDVEPAPTSFAIALVGATLAAGAIGAWRGGCRVEPRRAGAAPWVFAGAFALAVWAGLDVVPPLEDQDSEVQGTAQGLVRDFEPWCLTNRSTLHYFAHPPLLHVFAASTLTLAGELPAVRASYDAARIEWEKLPSTERRGLGAVAAALRGGSARRDYSVRWARDVYGAFLREPALLGTRAPNFVLAGAAAVLLYLWMRRLGVGSADALLGVAVYATLPEIFVRSGYGGYYSIGAATWLAGAWLSTGSAGGGRVGYFAGVLAALADQKALLLGGVVAVLAGARAVLERGREPLRHAVPFVLGVSVATIAFWIYGLAVAPHDFVLDHVREHFLARFSGEGATARPGRFLYPSRGALWVEFAAHYGPWAMVAGAAWMAAAIRVARRADSARATPLLLGWVAVVAIAFTITDWRQTKHLALLVPAASVLIGAMVAGAPAGPRWATRAVLLGSLGWNVVWIVRLARDFGAMKVSTLW